jgi:hypothetical protein
MWLTSLLRSGQRHGSPCKRPTFRARLEALEARCVPSRLTVTNVGDGGAGSLRYEIAQAQSGDTIVFNFATVGKHGTINLNNYPHTIYVSSELVLNKNLTIQGPGAGLLTISGYSFEFGSAYRTRIFEVDGAAVTLSGMTLSDGGGHDSSEYSPASPEGPDYSQYGYAGGAILNRGTLTISGCTLSNNSAPDPTNDVDLTWFPYDNYGNGGAIYNAGALTVSGCTLSNNSAGEDGGGIYNVGSATVNGCTLTGNSATHWDGGGIYNANYLASSLTVLDSIFSGNSSGDFYPSPNIYGPYTDGGGNTFH